MLTASRTADQSDNSKYAGWTKHRIEHRISWLARRIRVSNTGSARAHLRIEIDQLLEEHYRRWPT